MTAYYNELDKKAAAWLRELMPSAWLLPATWMNGALPMLSPQTLMDTPNATFSPAWADGQLRLDLQDGQMTGKSGPPRARASRSRSPGKAPELLMRGTYGQTFSASSVPDGPLSSWESRLRQRLARIGSSECDLIWKASAMSDGALLSRLVPSTPRTVEIDSGLLLESAYLVTPTTRDHKDTPGMSLQRPDGRSRIDQLPRQVAATMAMWPTPCVPNGGRSPKGGMSITGMTPDGIKRQVDLQEACRQVASALWPTPTAVDGARGLTTRPQDTGIPLPQRVGQVLGMAPAGSSATTAKRGVLNPLFVSWLMGFPMAWVMCSPSSARPSKK